MNVIPTALEGVVIIEPRIFADARGYFLNPIPNTTLTRL